MASSAESASAPESMRMDVSGVNELTFVESMPNRARTSFSDWVEAAAKVLP